MWLAGLGYRLHGFIRMYSTLLFDHYHFAMSGEEHLAVVSFSFSSTGRLPAVCQEALQTTAREMSDFRSGTQQHLNANIAALKL